MIMGSPIEKRAAANADEANSDGDSRNGLDLLSAVIDSRRVHEDETSTTGTTTCTVASTSTSTVVETLTDHNDDGCYDSSIISDHNSTSTTNISQPVSNIQHDSSHKRARTFPEVLMEILSNPDNEHIVGWLQHGKSFAIHNSTLFSSQILPKYFRRVIFRSFIRKLNRWGFRSSKRSISGFASTFEHKYFCRDEPELCARIYCKSNPTRRIIAKLGSVDSSSSKYMPAVATSVHDTIMTTNTSPNAGVVSSAAFTLAATQAALSQVRQHQLPLTNTGSSSLARFAFLPDDIQAQMSIAASLNHHHIRTTSTTSAPTICLPPSTEAVLSAASTQAVLSQAHQQLSYMNNGHMLNPPGFATSAQGGIFPSVHHHIEEKQAQLSKELLLLELQRQQRQRQQQALMTYLLYRQE